MTKEDKIRKLIKVAGFTDAAKEQIEGSFTMAKASKFFKPAYEKHFNWSEFDNMVIPYYVEHFTEEEIDSIINFYTSPIGEKILKFNGEGSSKLTKTLDAWVSEKYNAVMTDMTKTNE